ncbi:MAG TPA: hypothetical protein VN729_13685 [Ktedonobacteraceae bacterium]|nr:hypothetical protein [Ktedonobacteraceae bacterium]
MKQEDSTAIGRFLTVKETISFMVLRESVEGDVRVEVFAMPSLEEQTLYEPGMVEYACAEHFCSYEQFRGADDAFNVWVQCLFPALSIKWMQREQRAFALVADGETRTTLVIERRGEQIGVAVKGNCALWSEIVRAYGEWLVLREPGRECFRLVITLKGQEMRVEQPGESRPLTIVCYMDTYKRGC